MDISDYEWDQNAEGIFVPKHFPCDCSEPPPMSYLDMVAWETRNWFHAGTRVSFDTGLMDDPPFEGVVLDCIGNAVIALLKGHGTLQCDARELRIIRNECLN